MSLASSIFSVFRPLFSESVRNFNEIGNTSHKIPQFQEQSLLTLCSQIIEILAEEDSLLKISQDITVVGDIHGSLQDLLRIFHLHGIPPLAKYIFLGDYIDRGEYSIEVITLLLAMKCVFPSHVFLLRGNHEFEETNSLYGFRDQCVGGYSVSLYDSFNKVFSFLPLAAITPDRTFLVHGGISPILQVIDQIDMIPRPSINFTETPFRQLVLDLVWSDPNLTLAGFTPSQRGTGTIFGLDVLAQFMKQNNIPRMIRGHQCISNGVEQFGNENLYTVFSCSNYSPDCSNLSGIIKLHIGSAEFLKFPPLKHNPRTEAKFIFYENDKITTNALLFRSKMRSYSKQAPPRMRPCSRKQTITVSNNSVFRSVSSLPKNPKLSHLSLSEPNISVL